MRVLWVMVVLFTSPTIFNTSASAKPSATDIQQAKYEWGKQLRARKIWAKYGDPNSKPPYVAESWEEQEKRMQARNHNCIQVAYDQRRRQQARARKMLAKCRKLHWKNTSKELLCQRIYRSWCDMPLPSEEECLMYLDVSVSGLRQRGRGIEWRETLVPKVFPKIDHLAVLNECPDPEQDVWSAMEILLKEAQAAEVQKRRQLEVFWTNYLHTATWRSCFVLYTRFSKRFCLYRLQLSGGEYIPEVVVGAVKLTRVEDVKARFLADLSTSVQQPSFDDLVAFLVKLR